MGMYTCHCGVTEHTQTLNPHVCKTPKLKAAERWVEWIEPFGPNSEPVYCRIPESTAIATQRKAAEDIKPYESDERALEDFMTVHWATFVKGRI